MSRKPEKVVYRASWRDFIFANFAGRSFSTATGDYTHNHPPIKAGDKRSHRSPGLSLEVRPCGKRRQDNRSDPEGRIVFS